MLNKTTMKKILSLLAIIIYSFGIAQTEASEFILKNKKQSTLNTLQKIFITKDFNVFFRSPEPVQFVDLSNSNLIGDLPTNNIVRVKVAKFEENDNPLDTLNIGRKKEIHYSNGQDLGVVSIVGQSYMAQYRLVYITNNLVMGGGYMENDRITSNIQIEPASMIPLEYPNSKLSDYEMKSYSEKIVQRGYIKDVRNSKDYKMGIHVNNIYSFNDYIFLDVTFRNTTNLPYDIGNVEFFVDDKKIYKSTNNQTITVKPIYQLYDNSRFKSQFRNIYVFNKFTFPNDKVFTIRIYEKGISGRTLQVNVKYSDLLEADTL